MGISLSRQHDLIYSVNRREALLHQLYTDTAAFTDDPAESSDPDTRAKFAEFQSTFKIEEMTDDTAHQLDLYPELREMMESLVPEQIPYRTFWLRYYYHFWLIDQDEKKRKELLKVTGEAGGDDDFSWDAEEDEEEDPDAAAIAKTTIAKPKSTKPSDSHQDEEENEWGAEDDDEAATTAKATVSKVDSSATSPRDSSEGSYDVVSRSSTATDTKSEAESTPKKSATAAASTPLKTTTKDEDWGEWE